MDFLRIIWGEGKELTFYQMSLRALVVFILGLILVRLSGRRSFGMKMPFDNVIVILLGAILSRAVTGASPFIPVICASAVIVLLHRLCAWIALYHHGFGKLIKGREEVLYADGKINHESMKDVLVSEKDLIEGIHINANIDSLEQVDKVYLERDGQISVVKKEKK
jgi:uncharacterized membrane protein YcaP (DUF421 family)